MKKAELVRRIHKEFPELKFKKAVHNVEGWDHYVLILDNKYVFRFPRKKEYLRRLRTEFGLLKYLYEKVPLPIPQYRFIAHDKSFAGYDMLAGHPLTPEILKKLPQRIQNNIANQLAGFMNVMHRTPLSVARKFDPEPTEALRNYQKLIMDCRRRLFPKISPKSWGMIEELIKDLKPCLNFPKKCFIHTDLFPGHLLLSPNKKSLSGIIDFADRSIDDPAMDFTEFWIYGRKFVEAIYKSYRGPKDAKFLQRSFMYYKRSALWMMLASLDGRKGNFQKEYQIFRKIFKKEF